MDSTFHYPPLECTGHVTNASQNDAANTYRGLRLFYRFVSLLVPVLNNICRWCFFRAPIMRSVSLARLRLQEYFHETCTIFLDYLPRSGSTDLPRDLSSETAIHQTHARGRSAGSDVSDKDLQVQSRLVMSCGAEG